MPESAPDRPNGIRQPFRANYAGSLLRPPELLRAREVAATGKISAKGLRAGDLQ
jgi:5-methyltetrahydropteroyltriglutamate--homocysteine methyltransferase